MNSANGEKFRAVPAQVPTSVSTLPEKCRSEKETIDPMNGCSSGPLWIGYKRSSIEYPGTKESERTGRVYMSLDILRSLSWWE